ncbi:ABC transporter substrate-binding protein [Xanthobacter sp. KR7-65]|uniref:ABC transporter substrate-binding protein n=1 Tax=Xanthobacter sp. KR7-65 TaxID=3156612 RepID=UPI0032B38C01
MSPDEDSANPIQRGKSAGAMAPNRRQVIAGVAGFAISAPFVVTAKAAPATIPVGVVVGLTGRSAPWGIPVADATRLAIDMVNKSGGIKSKEGAKLELFVADHQSNPQMAGTQTERLIQTAGVLAVFGNAVSGATMVGSAAADRNKTPLISTDSGDTLSSRGLKYYFRIGARTSLLSQTAIDFAKSMAETTKVVPKSVAILADDTTFSQDAANGLVKALKGTDWPLFDNISFPAGNVGDFSPIIQRLKLNGVDLFLQATTAPDGIQILQACKALDYNPIASLHVLGAPYTPEFASNAKATGNYITDAVGYVPELVNSNPKIAEFGRIYKETYNRNLDDQASLAVNGVGILLDALERAPTLDREAITKALRETDLEVGSNPFIVRDGVKFSEAGDNMRAKALVMQIIDQQQRIVFPQTLATVKAVWPMPKWAARV